jgi:hypothetical protein
MTELYAWIAASPDGGEEQVMAVLPADGPAIVLLQHCKREVAERFRDTALRQARAWGIPVRLVRFVEAETIEQFAP